jgi:hypothetical protein
MIIKLATAAFVFIFFLGLSFPSSGQINSSNNLTIGYQGEGKVDGSSKSCRELAQSPFWTEDQIRQGADEVCDARRHHIEAYQKFQTAYGRLAKILIADRRLNLVAATDQLKQFVRSCIDHKIYITTGGHNIMIDIIPNRAAAECLYLSAQLLTNEAENMEAATAKSQSQPRRICEVFDQKADQKYRYLLCSDGLYDRKQRKPILQIANGIVFFVGQGYRAAKIKVPGRLSGLTWLTADGSRVLAWSNEDGLVLFERQVSNTHLLYVVAPNSIEQSGLFIGGPAPLSRCRWGEGALACDLKYLKTNEPDRNYALAEKDRVEAFILTYSREK